MKTVHFFLIAGCSLLLGFFFFAYIQEWVIVRYPLQTATNNSSDSDTHTIKKKVKLIFWHHNKWKTEHLELMWSDNKNNNILYLINSWLSLLDEEGVIDKKVTLQTAILNGSEQEVFLSFDQNFLSPEQPTYTKLMLVEGLLKTIRDNGIPVRMVRFLVHHQPLSDDHLDFSNAWPINGFAQL